MHAGLVGGLEKYFVERLEKTKRKRKTWGCTCGAYSRRSIALSSPFRPQETVISDIFIPRLRKLLLLSQPISKLSLALHACGQAVEISKNNSETLTNNARRLVNKRFRQFPIKQRLTVRNPYMYVVLMQAEESEDASPNLNAARRTCSFSV